MSKQEEAPKQAACKECGHLQDWLQIPCELCGSLNVFLVFFLEREYGSDWRDKLLTNKGEEHQRPSTQAPRRVRG